MVEFKTVTLADKAWVDEIVMNENSRSADYNFGNIYIWDKHYRQLVCRCGDRMLTKLRYEGKPTFVFPCTFTAFFTRKLALRTSHRGVSDSN